MPTKGADLLGAAEALDWAGLYFATQEGENTAVELTARILGALRIVPTSLGENGDMVLVNEQAEFLLATSWL